MISVDFERSAERNGWAGRRFKTDSLSSSGPRGTAASGSKNRSSGPDRSEREECGTDPCTHPELVPRPCVARRQRPSVSLISTLFLAGPPVPVLSPFDELIDELRSSRRVVLSGEHGSADIVESQSVHRRVPVLVVLSVENCRSNSFKPLEVDPKPGASF